MSEPLLSVIVCTHNRCRVLDDCLKCLDSQDMPKDQFEIIVVDNASNDMTSQVCDRYRSFSNFRYVVEPVLGLSVSRNTGLKYARGEIVAFLDDDAFAEPEWARSILLAHEKSDPGSVCVGGKVVPRWGKERPEWLSDKLLFQLSLVDWGGGRHVLREGEWLVGANISYNRRALIEIGGFSSRLGRKGAKLLSMEENEVRSAIEERGWDCVYDPAAVVAHYVPGERLIPRWFLRRSFWNGASEGIISLKDKGTAKSVHILKAMTTIIRVFLDISDIKALIARGGYTKELFNKKCSVYARLGHSLALLGVIK